jgi:Tol biopolymer transport system component
VINADGTALRRLTKLRHNVETMNPAWSPYGDKIAFDEYRYPPQLSNSTYVIRADGTHVTRLEPLDAYGEQTWFWFSDDRIAYPAGSGFKSIDPEGTTRPKALPNRVHVGRDLWIASTTDRPPGESWPISPDGKWIAFVGRGLSIEHLDRTHRRLVTRKICCFFGSPAPEWVGN